VFPHPFYDLAAFTVVFRGAFNGMVQELGGAGLQPAYQADAVRVILNR
jgi:hypothetical protein